MLKSIVNKVGFMLIANSLLFTPIGAAAADTADAATKGFIFVIPGGLITGIILVMMSKKKTKATKAEHYTDANIKLDGQRDIYLRKTTSKRELNKDKD